MASDAILFDDLQLGQSWTSRPIEMTVESIVAFGKVYDPQAFHTDPIAAEKSQFGGLIASGWHVTALMMREFVEARPFGSSPLVGLGVDEIKWTRPVRPGDVLTVHGEIVALTPSRSKPDRGIVRWKIEVKNQLGELVMSGSPNTMLARRS